jgi:hypothetical protein
MERMLVIVAVIGVVFLIVRDFVDLYSSRERGFDDDGSDPRTWDYVMRSLDTAPHTERGSTRRRASTRLRYIAKDCKVVKAYTDSF